jgi:UDP-glucose 4-epimerase
VAHCLVTGGAGFLGSHVAAELVDEGHSVVVLDDLSGGSVDRVPAGAEFVNGSVCDARTVDDVFAGNHFDWVFHFAAFAAEVISHTVKQHNYVTNVLGTVNLINASVRTGVSFFGFASSVGVYGHGPTPMSERHEPQPCDSYGIAKLTMERELAVTMRHQGLPYTAYRMHNVYGERQNMQDPYRNAVAIFLNQMMRDEPISVYGSGRQVRAFTYVRDIVPVIVRSARTPAAWGHSVNVGSSHRYSLLELVDAVRHSMGAPTHPVVHLPARAEVAEAYTDTSLARDLLGPWPDTPLQEALAATAEWARTNGPVDFRPSVDLELPDAHVPEWARIVADRIALQRNVSASAEPAGRT